ncbi:MAG TPA: metallophosphoesterase [Blastocatellia bacterium]|nr:metallophosphoesterase [Blastocatellia bacterium]
MLKSRLALALILLFFAVASYGQNSTAQNQKKTVDRSPRSYLTALKSPLREKAQSLLDQKDDSARARLASEIAFADPAAARDFLLAVLSTEQSVVVRRAIISSLGNHIHPKVQQELERFAATDADVGVALLALERLRRQRMHQTRGALERRIEMARASNDKEALAKLAQEHERWVSLVRGVMLPAFLRVTPAAFSLKPAEQPIRVLAFGDFGVGSSIQKQVASAMLEYHRKSPFDFGITLGDNFYNEGMESPTTDRWKRLWDELYDPLGIKFYATLGNHDWLGPDSPAAEILYSDRSPTWRLPAPYYTYTAGPVQFFAIDTNEMSAAQVMWLDEELKKSTARWKLVYGHHPIYSDGDHGDNAKLIEKLLPILKGKADAYFAGHDHTLEQIKPEGGLHFFVSGGGGARLYKVKQAPRAVYVQSIHGFTVIEADQAELRVRFIGTDMNQLHESTIKK